MLGCKLIGKTSSGNLAMLFLEHHEDHDISMIRKPNPLSQRCLIGPVGLTISVPGAVDRNKLPEDHRHFDETPVFKAYNRKHPIRSIRRHIDAPGCLKVLRQAALDLFADSIVGQRFRP